MCKFRTMTDERDENGELLPDARRLTPFGSFLRKTSLDELPELWNIFKGDMSLIGPRPLLVGYLPYYTERERLRHTVRPGWLSQGTDLLAVRPGLTGLSQVSGRNFLGWDERLAMDVEYVERLSFLMDAKVFFQTIAVVFRSDDVSVDSEAVECYLWEIRQKREDEVKDHE